MGFLKGRTDHDKAGSDLSKIRSELEKNLPFFIKLQSISILIICSQK